MARYIDAEKIDFSPLKDDFDRSRAKVIIMGQPTADVAEVKHGEWLYRHEHATYSCHSIRIVCNECNHYFARLDGENFKYCPNCGAKMDGQKEGTK